MADETPHAARRTSGTSTTPVVEAVSPEVRASIVASRRWQNRKRLLLYACLLGVLGVGTLYAVQLWQYYSIHTSTDDAYVVGEIVPLSPRVIVPLSPRVNGTVLSVHVEEHQPVAAGQLLARLDPRDFVSRVAQAEAAVTVAAARLHQAEIEVPLTRESTSSDTARTSATLRGAHSALQEAQHKAAEAQSSVQTREAAMAAARAEVDMLHARLDMARMAFKRLQQLLADGLVAQQQFDEAESGLRAAQAVWHAGQQKLAQAQSEVERARADLRT
jgi:membrane fusion protein (multidrug efflux system)